MTKLPIFTETADGKLVPMRPSAPPDEDSLQELIGRFPEIISGDGEPLLLVRREISVPDSLDGAARWSLDHLFVSRSAVPVLVEVKRATDTRIRREVIGQLLDYAANGVAYWQPGTLAAEFDKQCVSDDLDPDLELAQFLREDDVSEFWEQVDANLSAGRVRLIVAADSIPKELARIIEFMNEQMRCTVLAVELTYFESDDGRRTLAPKVIGETERTDVAKQKGRQKLEPISMSEWINKHLKPRGEDVISATKKYRATIEELGGKLTVASTQGSIVASWSTEDAATTYPLFLGSNGRVSIGFGWIASRPKLKDEQVRAELLHQIDAAVEGLSTNNTNGHPSFPVERLNDLAVIDAFKRVASKLTSLAIQGEG